MLPLAYGHFSLLLATYVSYIMTATMTYAAPVSFSPFKLVFASGDGTITPYNFTPPASLVPASQPAVKLQDPKATPNWITFSPLRPLFYATDEKNGIVNAIQVDDDFHLTPADAVSVGDGSGPTHSTTVGDFLFTANYGTGSVSIFQLNKVDGTFTAESPDRTIILPGCKNDQVSQHGYYTEGGNTNTNATTTLESCAHQVIADPSQRWLYVTDRCADKIHRLKLADSINDIAIVDETVLPRGSGPRHLRFWLNTRTGATFAYLASEQAATLTAFQVTANGCLHPIGQPQLAIPRAISTYNRTTSEVAVAPDGRFVYVATRGDELEDHVSIFARDKEHGDVKFQSWVQSGGRHLRHFSLSPDADARYLAAAHRDTENVTILKRDPDTGHLTKTSASAEQVGPVLFAGFVLGPSH